MLPHQFLFGPFQLLSQLGLLLASYVLPYIVPQAWLTRLAELLERFV